MSREIKFRYVYKCKECGKVITKDLTLEQVEGLHIGFESVGSVQCSCDSYGRNFAELVDRLQFTGLHDKHGKEIYEGDVLAWHFDDGDIVGSVRYSPLESGFLFYPVEINLYGIGGRRVTSTMEVVGNIHENPELMEGKE